MIIYLDHAWTWPGCHRNSTPILGGAWGLRRGVLWSGPMTVEERGRCGLSWNLSPLTRHFRPTNQAEMAWRALERGLPPCVPSCPQEGAEEDTHSPSPAPAWSTVPRMHKLYRHLRQLDSFLPCLGPRTGGDLTDGISLKLAAPGPSIRLS